jgi:hypothetical protein
MPSSFVSLFCKTVCCPTSQALLAYHALAPVNTDHANIENHLGYCDFCSAELQLLTRHCSDAEEYSFVEMPTQFRRVAEDLLKASNATIRGFAELGEKGKLSH